MMTFKEQIINVIEGMDKEKEALLIVFNYSFKRTIVFVDIEIDIFLNTIKNYYDPDLQMGRRKITEFQIVSKKFMHLY